jgi:ribose transport system ATP-binding protein
VGQELQPYLELKNAGKFFGITRALRDVNLRINLGEVVGLVGPNGAGKSTLIKIIAGVFPPDSGEIHIGSTKFERYTARDAKEAGVSCAYQDLSLCTNLKVYENFALLSMSHTLFGVPEWQRYEKRKTAELLERCFPGSGINVMKPVSALSLADRQIVEICKALTADNMNILVLDEPTSALSTDKARQLHSLVRALGAAGKAVIYISHKLDEIAAVCDRIVLMRNGEVAAERRTEDTSAGELVRLLGGEITAREAPLDDRQDSAARDSRTAAVRKRLVGITGLSGHNLHGINFCADAGEIVGVSGLAGSGQNELLNHIFNGARRKKGPETRIEGSAAYISGDRAVEGIFPLWNIFDNMLVSSLKRLVSGLFLSKKKSETLAGFWYDKLKFKAEGIYSPVMSLSGGNQQKALIARGIASGADILILNDPTAGVDIETKQEIYSLLKEVKAAGRSVVFYSTEDAEMEICDRVYIMRDGAITGELEGSNITVPNIVKASFTDTNIKKSGPDNDVSTAQKLLSSRALLPLFTMALMVCINAAFNPNVLSYNSIRMLAGAAVPLVFAGLGQMFIVGVGDIDMGNGYSIGLVNVLIAVVLTGNPLFGALSLLVFIAAYALMGALVEARKIPAIVVTLGAQFIWLGAALILCPVPGGSCPQWLSSFYRFKFLFVPAPVIVCIAAAFLCYFILFKAKYGIVLRGAGNNPQALTRSGWSYLAAKMTAYALSGTMVVLSGMFFTAVCLGADANASSSFCMLSIATVVIGGCEFSGGVIEPAGVVAAAVAMSLITTALTFMRIGSNYQTAVLGVILIMVLVIKLIANRDKGYRV